MKILEQNGFKYSRGQFEGYEFRSLFKLEVDHDYENTTTITICTDNPNKEEVKKVIDSRRAEKVTSCVMIHWCTKEQDDLTTQFIEETLKDL